MGRFTDAERIDLVWVAIAVAAAALLCAGIYQVVARRGAQARTTQSYLAAFVLGTLFTLLLCVGAVAAMSRFAPQHLPPPAISNQISFDEKLLFLRRHPELRPSILGAGSSITLRSLDGSAFQPEGAKPLFFNAGLAGGQIHQIRYATTFFLELFPTVDTVVQIAVPPDFSDCTTKPERFFDARDARAFTLDEMSAARAYFKYFNPHELIPDAFEIAEKRQGWDERASERLYMDAFGTMPMQVSPQEAQQRHRELYTQPQQLDPSCFVDLARWSGELAMRGKRLYVVVPPISPVYLQRIPGAAPSFEEFASELRDALAGEPAILIDMRRDLPLGAEAFADAYHLQWSAARQFSRKLAEIIRRNDLRPIKVAAPPQNSLDYD